MKHKIGKCEHTKMINITSQSVCQLTQRTVFQITISCYIIVQMHSSVGHYQWSLYYAGPKKYYINDWNYKWTLTN